MKTGITVYAVPCDPEIIFRAMKVNLFLNAVARCGRKFYAHDGSVSQFAVNMDGALVFRDAEARRDISTHHLSKWKNFTGGGTLLALAKSLAVYIRTGKLPRLNLGPWPKWICDGDIWGYGPDMDQVRAAAAEHLDWGGGRA